MSMDGCLKLELASRDGITGIVDRFQRAPLQVQKVLYPRPDLPGMAWVYIVSVAGGIVQGDRLWIEISARDGAHVHLTTPAATKIYRSPASSASHRLRISAGAGTHVEYLPEPIIPFRGARFQEEVTLVAHPKATLMYGGILSPGRVAMGESHVYDLYSSRLTAVGADDAPEFLDVMHLTPATINPKRPGLLGTFDVLGTLHVLTGVLPASALCQRLRTLLDGQAGLLAGASELPSGRGVTVRILGSRVEPVSAAIQAALTDIRQGILGSREPCDEAPRDGVTEDGGRRTPAPPLGGSGGAARPA